MGTYNFHTSDAFCNKIICDPKYYEILINKCQENGHIMYIVPPDEQKFLVEFFMIFTVYQVLLERSDQER